MEVNLGGELKKHVNTIHCSNEMSLIQRKLFNALLFNAYHDLNSKLVFVLTTKKLCQLIGYNSNDYGTLKKALIGMIGTVIEWNVIDNNQPKIEQWKASSLVSAVDFKNGICTYEFSSILKEYLYQPEIYGLIDIKIQANFKSVYGLALYENCVRYKNIKQTPWIGLGIFRKLMGVDPKKYAVFRDFKKRVIDQSVLEVNSFSNLNVSVEFLKENRQVTAVKFLIDIKFCPKILDKKEPESLKLKLTDFGLSDKQIIQIFNSYEDEYIREKINYVESTKTFQDGRIEKLAPYLLNALEKNYQSSKSSKEVLYVLNQQKEIQKNLEAEKIKNEELQKKQQYQLLISKIEKFFNEKSESSQEKIKQDFLNSLREMNDKLIVKKYLKDGLENKIVKACFREFIKNNYIENI